MRALVYDALEEKPFLSYGWQLGSLLYKFDKVIPGVSWGQVIEDLVETPGVFNEIQWWGHGRSGAAVLAGRELTPEHRALPSLIEKLNKDSLLWFRSCSTFQGTRGKEFAMDMAAGLGCRVAGHTHIIAFPFQSGLHSVRPLQVPSWSTSEGVGPDGKSKNSSLWAPNTIYTWRDAIPTGW